MPGTRGPPRSRVNGLPAIDPFFQLVIQRAWIIQRMAMWGGRRPIASVPFCLYGLNEKTGRAGWDTLGCKEEPNNHTFPNCISKSGGAPNGLGWWFHAPLVRYSPWKVCLFFDLHAPGTKFSGGWRHCLRKNELRCAFAPHPEEPLRSQVEAMVGVQIARALVQNQHGLAARSVRQKPCRDGDRDVLDSKATWGRTDASRTTRALRQDSFVTRGGARARVDYEPGKRVPSPSFGRIEA